MLKQLTNGSSIPMNVLDILCKCGHSFSQHQREQDSSSCVCIVPSMGKSSDWEQWADKCMKYVPDNLTHIEQLAKQKGLV